MTDSINPVGETPDHQRGTTRRRLLGGGAAATALGAALAVMPPNVRQALAEPLPAGSRPGSLKDIKHVVLLMQENRSFDPSMKVVLTPTCLTSHARMRLRA